MRKHRSIPAFILIFVLFFTTLFISETASATSQVLPGKGKWLFYRGLGDGYPLYDYQGINHFSPLNLKRLEANLSRARKAVEQKGCEFIVYMAPNKECIYTEYMPSSIKRRSTYTRCDQLYDYLEYNTDFSVCYPKDELLAAKKDFQIYYPTDTHWNRIGQFIGVQELLDVTDGHKLSPYDVKFGKSKTGYRGDLLDLSNGRYHYSVANYYLASKISKADKSNKKIFIVGDSFGHRLAFVAQTFYKNVRYCHINNFSMSKVKKGETVVWECVERYIDKFSRINFAAR